MRSLLEPNSRPIKPTMPSLTPLNQSVTRSQKVDSTLVSVAICAVPVTSPDVADGAKPVLPAIDVTVIIGKLSQEQKRQFTTVDARGHLSCNRLQQSIFSHH